MKLKQLASNMTELQTNGATRILFSYKTPVAAYITLSYGNPAYAGKYVKTNKKWSKTTSKHINKWLLGLEVKDVIKVDQLILDHLLDNLNSFGDNEENDYTSYVPIIG